MKEREYIDATDLQKLRSAKAILSDICIKSQPVITQTGWAQIHHFLESYIERISAKIEDMEE